MNIYVESNFILELALFQEQSGSCGNILKLCETGRAQLVVPAYSLAEPYETLVRRHRQRNRLRAELNAELHQIARSTSYADRLSGFRDLTALLSHVAEEDSRSLEEVRSRLIKIANLIPLDRSVLNSAGEYRERYGFSPQDAFVYASVLLHLQQDRTSTLTSCFLNKNYRDFEDQRIERELEGLNCKFLPRFDSGYQFILNALAD